MDISVLTEQRREMVINLLKGMKIRKSDGEGFDKDDVYACMQQLCDVYEKSVDDLTESYETEISELQEKYQKYDENNDLYVSLIMEAKRSSNEIINKAKAEVDEILAAGKEQIAAQEEELEQLRAETEQAKVDLALDLEDAKAAAAREAAALAAGVEAEKKKAEEVRKSYRDQIAVMDQEFDEIKTNILRTAGKIDGLKAQLEDTEAEHPWKLQDEPPAPEEPEEFVTSPTEMTFEQLVSKLQQDDAASIRTAEVEGPAEPPVIEPEIEPEIEEPAPEQPEEAEFHFEPTFAPIDIPAGQEEDGTFEEPAPDISEADIQAEIPAEELLADIPLDVSFTETGIDGLDAAAGEEAISGEISLDSILEEAKMEEAAEGEEPIEEISFEGLEELFKD